MIFTDTFGEKVNAESFTVEIINGYGPKEHGEPVILLKGERTYFRNRDLTTKKCTLKRDTLTLKMVDKYLKLKKTYSDKQEEIDKEIEEEAKKINPKNAMWLSYKLKAEKGYSFFEDDESVDMYDECINARSVRDIILSPLGRSREGFEK